MSLKQSSQPVLGYCPDCEVEIATLDVIIEYETAGQPAIWAECPACGDVVHPE